MKITLSTHTPTNSSADLVAVAVPSAKSARKKALADLEKAFGGNALAKLVEDERFEGQKGQILKIAGRGKVKARWLLLVGIGSDDDVIHVSRRLGHAIGRAAKGQKTAAVQLPKIDTDAVTSVVEGLTTGAYRYNEYRSKPKAPALASLSILGAKSRGDSFAPSIRQGKIVGDAINFARDLVNQPPNDLNPVTLAKAAQKEARKIGIPCTVWDKRRIEKEKMQLFLAVNAGSDIEPRMIHVTHKPANARAKVVFVGKGLTFDAGGLCIKPAKSMVDMKCDMAGAAATLGIVFAAARLKVPIEVHAVVGSTENMTGGKAYRPGDVYKSLEGKTVEVINTDAEGRMVLADVLAWCTRKLKPDYMIDHATLTGACMVGLGPYRAGLYSDDDDLAGRYLIAAEAEEESFWRMPLDGDLRSMLNSPIADLKHIGGPYGGSITAALFLKEFVGKTTWMHLDIAGPAFLDRPHGRHPKGGTGFGVATGVRFLSELAASHRPKRTKKKRSASKKSASKKRTAKRKSAAKRKSTAKRKSSTKRKRTATKSRTKRTTKTRSTKRSRR